MSAQNTTHIPVRRCAALAAALLIHSAGSAVAVDLPDRGLTATPSKTDDSNVSAPALTRPDLEAWLDGMLPYALASGDVAGAVVVVVKDGAVLLEKGYGYADVGARKPVDPQSTLFRPGSISKLFTATAVMQLVEKGELDLDRDINTYLDFRIPERDGRPITLRNVLTHTAGFEEQIKGLLFTDAANAAPLEAHLKRWIPRRIFAAGDTPGYSNYALALAGYIVARKSGRSFEDYMDEHVLGPLGMQHSSFRQPLPEHLRDAVSRGYRRASEPPLEYEFVGPAPAGSLAATGADMARFMIAQLQSGAIGSQRLLAAETVRQMQDHPLRLVPPLNGMLLGFYEAQRNGRRIIAHNGGTICFNSDLHLYVDEGVALFISINSTGKEGAARRIRSALFEEFTDRYLPGPTPQGNVEPAVAARDAALLSGWYLPTRRSDSTFFSIVHLFGQSQVVAGPDGTITSPEFTNAAGIPIRWREIGPLLWREVDGKHLLAAQVAAGKVQRFSVDQAAPAVVFEPVPAWKSAGWLHPLFYFSLLVLSVAALLWPAGALVRRHYGAAQPLTGRQLSQHRWTRIGAAAAMALVLSWSLTFAAIGSDYNLMSPRLDKWLWVLLVLTPIICTGAVAASVWNAWLAFVDRRSWHTKLWSVSLVLAFATTFWVALVGKLMTFSVNY